MVFLFSCFSIESPVFSVFANGSLCIHKSLNYEEQALYDCLVFVYSANQPLPVAQIPLFVIVVDISFFFYNHRFLTTR